MSAVRTPDAECLARTLQALAAERPDEGLAAILAALRESFAAPGAAVLRVEGSRLVPAASDGLKVGPRALKGGTGAPRNGGYPLVVAGQLEGMLLLAGVSQETLRREAGRVQPWLDLAAVALRNARLTAERERARSDAERRVRTFRALHELGLAIAGVLDPAALARLATDRARDLLPIDQAHVYLWDPTDGRLQHLDGNGPRPAARTIQPGEGATGLAFTRREAVVVENYQRWPSALRHVKARGVRVAAAVPLLVDDRAIGALVAASSRHHRFETTDLRRLSLLAAQVAPALEAARLHVESERRRAEAEALAELARRGAAERDPDEVMRLVTRQACRLLGADYGAVALREPEGRAGWHGVSGNRTDAWRTASFDRGPGLVARALADGRPFILERIGDDPSLPLSHFPIQAAEGGRTALGVPLSSNDQPLGVLLLGWRSDVTVSPEQIRLAEALASYAATVLDRARAHAAAAERAAERTAVIEQMPNGVVVFDRSGRVVLMNDAASRILGVPPGSPLMGVANAPSAFELRDSASGARLQPEQLPSARALAGEVIRHYELLLRRPGETEDRWLEESAEPLWGSDGAVIGALMVISDVTEQRRLIRDLARSEARFRTLCEAVTCGVLVRDSDGQIVDANEAAEQILGLSLEELRGQRWSAALQAAAGEDATSLPEAERPAAIALRTGQPVRNYTLAVRRPDGQRRWLQVDAVPAFAPDGAIAQVVTSFIDVTARTEAEAALRARVRQQAAIARLGQQALAGGDLAALMDETALLVAEALGVPYATLWELVPDGSTLVLRAGVGWGADVGPGTRR
ncbi:MAG TPA: GAF domain-containing protein, partial [Chloroflexota bacterium]|nr:GAF domain-containing protein [Chloroflexota bacterium]